VKWGVLKGRAFTTSGQGDVEMRDFSRYAKRSHFQLHTEGKSQKGEGVLTKETGGKSGGLPPRRTLDPYKDGVLIFLNPADESKLKKGWMPSRDPKNHKRTQMTPRMDGVRSLSRLFDVNKKKRLWKDCYGRKKGIGGLGAQRRAPLLQGEWVSTSVVAAER